MIEPFQPAVHRGVDWRQRTIMNPGDNPEGARLADLLSALVGRRAKLAPSGRPAPWRVVGKRRRLLATPRVPVNSAKRYRRLAPRYAGAAAFADTLPL